MGGNSHKPSSREVTHAENLPHEGRAAVPGRTQPRNPHRRRKPGTGARRHALERRRRVGLSRLGRGRELWGQAAERERKEGLGGCELHEAGEVVDWVVIAVVVRMGSH